LNQNDGFSDEQYEIENMAVNVEHDHADEQEVPLEDTITRWKALFRYSHSKVKEMIEQHCRNVSREHVSDEH